MALINQQDTIEAISLWLYDKEDKRTIDDVINVLPSIQIESLTDYEQRIFLSAMEKERMVCEKLTNEWNDMKLDVPCPVNLLQLCDEVERKVKETLWTN